MAEQQCLSLCAVAKCLERVHARGHCNVHYQRLRKYGSAEYNPIKARNTSVSRCDVPGCAREARTRGLCGAHWYRKQHGIPLDKPLGLRRPVKMINSCAESGCSREIYAKALCRKHYARKQSRHNPPSADVM
jgi:hypothetical protein